MAAVDDDGLAGGNPASTAGDLDANVGDLDGAASSEATFSGVLGGSVGTDGAGSNGFSFAGLDGQPGTVGQENVTYSWNAGSNTLTATTVGGTRPGTALFTVQVTDAATGAYTVTLLDNVLHAGGPERRSRRCGRQPRLCDHRRRRLDRQRHADRHLRRRCAERDGEPGRAARRRCACRRQSRTPADGDVDPDTANTSGTLAHSYGADGAGTTLLTAAGDVLPAGFTAAVSNGGLTLTISQGATAVLQIQLADTISGSYTVTQLAAIDHPVAGTEDNLQFTVGYVATDGDGDTATGSLSIDVDDDTPTAAAEASQDVPEGTTVTGTLDFAGGADGATVTHIDGTLLVFNPADDDYSQAIDIGFGFIKVKADGSYSFTADAVSSGPVALTSATFTVTDGDGDTATATIDFQVVDANVPTPGTAAAAVDDDALAGGNPASTTGDLDANVGDLDDPADASEATFTGVLGGSVGADGAGSNGFSFAGLDGQSGTVGQENVTYSWTAGSTR